MSILLGTKTCPVCYQTVEVWSSKDGPRFARHKVPLNVPRPYLPSGERAGCPHGNAFVNVEDEIKYSGKDFS